MMRMQRQKGKASRGVRFGPTTGEAFTSMTEPAL
jgi:hypothetical protein